jgi:hypothetical protein
MVAWLCTARALAKSAAERTQRDNLLLLLEPGGWVDSLTLALDGGGLDYCARICELRKQGVVIETRLNPDCPKGRRWYQYRLEKNGEAQRLF